MLQILIVVWVTWMHKFVQTHQNVHLKSVHFMVYKLHFGKGNKKPLDHALPAKRVTAV